MLEPAERAGHRVLRTSMGACSNTSLMACGPGLPVLSTVSLEPGHDGVLDSLTRLGCTGRPEPEGPPAVLGNTSWHAS